MYSFSRGKHHFSSSSSHTISRVVTGRSEWLSAWQHRFLWLLRSSFCSRPGKTACVHDLFHYSGHSCLYRETDDSSSAHRFVYYSMLQCLVFISDCSLHILCSISKYWITVILCWIVPLPTKWEVFCRFYRSFWTLTPQCRNDIAGINIILQSVPYHYSQNERWPGIDSQFSSFLCDFLQWYQMSASLPSHHYSYWKKLQ